MYVGVLERRAATTHEQDGKIQRADRGEQVGPGRKDVFGEIDEAIAELLLAKPGPHPTRVWVGNDVHEHQADDL